MTYLVPMKPVLHSRTKIAGAARAANLSKSSFIAASVARSYAMRQELIAPGPSAISHIEACQTKISNEECHGCSRRRRRRCWKPLQVTTVQLEGPREGEVLVEIKATGVCHTEFTLSGADPEGLFPAILGHEGAGVVVDIGKGVTS